MTVKQQKGRQMRKRGRTSYSPRELEILEKYFKKNPYLNPTLRGYLCGLLGYNASQLKIWYQNRRMRLKKECIKQEKAAAIAGEDGVSSSGSDDNRRIVAQLRTRNHNRLEGTSSGSFQTSLPLYSSMDGHEGNSLSGPPGSNFPSVPHTGIPSPNVEIFRPLYSNYRNTHDLINSSAPTSTVRGNDHAATSQPSPMQFHHSLYTGSQVPRRTPFPDPYTRFEPNLTSQNQQGAPHSPSYANLVGLGSMGYANAGNFMYRADSHTNGGYRMPYDHRNLSGRMYPNAMHSHYSLNSYHSACAREDQNNFDSPADFSRSRFTEMRSGKASDGNPYNWQRYNRVKVESPRQPVQDENSGLPNHYIPNNFNMNLDFPAPGVTANTYRPHPNTSFNQASAYCPPQSRDMQATNMHRALDNQKRCLSDQGQFSESQNINLPACSTNETYNPTAKSYEDPKQSFPGLVCLGTSVNSCRELPDKYMDCLSPGTSELSLTSCKGNPNCEIDSRCNISEESDIPSWEQIFTEPLRKLQDLSHIECSAHSPSNTAQSYMASQADTNNSLQH